MLINEAQNVFVLLRKTTDYLSWFHTNHSAASCSHLFSTWFQNSHELIFYELVKEVFIKSQSFDAAFSKACFEKNCIRKRVTLVLVTDLFVVLLGLVVAVTII